MYKSISKLREIMYREKFTIYDIQNINLSRLSDLSFLSVHSTRVFNDQDIKQSNLHTVSLTLREH